MAEQAKKTKKSRKFGRNKVFCERYRREGRREKAKTRQLKKHLARFPDDLCATEAFKRLATFKKAA